MKNNNNIIILLVTVILTLALLELVMVPVFKAVNTITAVEENYEEVFANNDELANIK